MTRGEHGSEGVVRLWVGGHGEQGVRGKLNGRGDDGSAHDDQSGAGRS